MKYLEITKKDEFVWCKINRGKVNAINHDLVHEIRSTFNSFKSDDEIRGVILTGKPHYFSAGLDLVELYQYGRPETEAFFEDFGMMHIELVQFPKPLICAISGHSPAGGTVIAVTADYRIMAEGERYTIGLNEVAVNVQISQNLITAYNFWLGQKQSYLNIMSGKLLTVSEALNQGLVDEVCPLEELEHVAERKMKKWLQANHNILVNTKQKLRKAWINSLFEHTDHDLNQTLEIWWNPQVREMMKAYIEHFLGKKV